jgi:hypothetical protein
LRWVIGGALNKQIAAQLGIAEKTVKIHRGRVMEKLAVGSVAELVRSLPAGRRRAFEGALNANTSGIGYGIACSSRIRCRQHIVTELS